MSAPIVFGISGWCRLLAHACTAGEHCSCDCHRRGTPRPSTALPAPGASYGPTDSVLRVGET